jgi:hypothetical protein
VLAYTADAVSEPFEYTPDGGYCYIRDGNYDFGTSNDLIDLHVQGVSDADEGTTGGTIALNDNFDEQNLGSDGQIVPDNLPDTVTGERIRNGYGYTHDDQLVWMEVSEFLNIAGQSLQPAAGTLTLSFPNQIKIWYVNDQGNYVQAQSGGTFVHIDGFGEGGGDWLVFIEGVSASDASGDVEFTATFTPDDTTYPPVTDTVRLTVAHANLKIDANNDGTVNDADDLVEDITGDDSHPGKVILVDNADSDHDGIPDYLDGFNLLPGVTDDDVSSSTHFVPMQVDLTGAPSDATVTFDYQASDPAKAISVYADPSIPPPAGLRIWAKDGDQARNKSSLADGGDFISPGVPYTLSQLGLTGFHGLATLYVEAVGESQSTADLPVTITVSDGKTTLTDRARFTATRIQILQKSSVAGIADFETHGFIATRLPTYDITTGDPEFNDFAPSYTINVFDPRATISQVHVDGQTVSLTRTGDHYSTGPVMAIRQSEQPLLAANQPVSVQSVDGVYTERPSDIVGDATVVAIPDGEEPTIQYNPEQKGTELVFAKYAAGVEKIIADAVESVENNLFASGWRASNPADLGSFGDVIHSQSIQKIAQAAGDEVLTNALVNWQTRELIAVGVTQGTAKAAQVDVIILAEGYHPVAGQHQFLDFTKIKIVDIKSSARGTLGGDQLLRLREIQGGDIKRIWTRYKWLPGSNTLVENPLYLRHLDVLNSLGLKQIGLTVLAVSAIVGFADADDAFRELDDALYKLQAESHKSIPSNDQIFLAEAVVVTKMKNVFSIMCGGTLDDAANVAFLDYVYGRLIPRMSQPYWNKNQSR